MKVRFLAFITLAALCLNVAATGKPTRVSRSKQNDELVRLLPASDAVVVLDSKRFFDRALPTLLSANQPLLAEITGKLDELQQKVGIDLRKFDNVAAGFTIKAMGEKEVDYDPVIVARGTLPSGGLLSVVKIASNGKYKEETIGTKTVYIFSAKDFAQQNAGQNGNSKVAAAIDRTINGMASEVALTALDGNTLAFGSVERVRLALSAPGHVDAEITSLLSKKADSVGAFVAKTPTGIGKFVPLDNDELGKTFNSVRLVAGSVDLIEGNAVLNGLARTTDADSAEGLLETLQGFQMLGKAFLGGSNKPENAIYARMIDNVSLGRNGSEVAIDLKVPQSDIDALVGQIK